MPDAFSIVAIIPLYNGARYIEQAVRSVLSQTLPPDEFIVVDDGSTDDGPEIVRRLSETEPKIRLISKPNGGQSSARNFGVASSTGSLIALLDQDDFWLPGHLAELVKPFRAWAGSLPLGWSYSDLTECDETGCVIHSSFYSMISQKNPKSSLFEFLQADIYVLPSSSLISRLAFDGVGGFDERLSGYEDDDLFLRIFRKGYANAFVDQPLSFWRIYPGSTSFSSRMSKSRFVYMKKLIETYPDDAGTNRYFVRDLIAPRFYRGWLGRYLHAMQLGDAAGMREASDGLHLLLPYFPTLLGIEARLAIAIMPFPRLAKFVAALWKTVRPGLSRMSPHTRTTGAWARS